MAGSATRVRNHWSRQLSLDSGVKYRINRHVVMTKLLADVIDLDLDCSTIVLSDNIQRPIPEIANGDAENVDTRLFRTSNNTINSNVKIR